MIVFDLFFGLALALDHAFAVDQQLHRTPFPGEEPEGDFVDSRRHRHYIRLVLLPEEVVREGVYDLILPRHHLAFGLAASPLEASQDVLLTEGLIDLGLVVVGLAGLLIQFLVHLLECLVHVLNRHLLVQQRAHVFDIRLQQQFLLNQVQVLSVVGP